ncbi:MAG: hypothetical protein JW767_04700 [Thermoleophilia bacterium]|nr:hypothetical protein [Thermoleophilia bacterium]
MTLSALVNEGAQQRMGPDGRVVNAKACVVLMPSASGEAPPAVSLRDRLTLPSGLSGPIVEVEAVAANPDTGAPFARVVWIG